MQFPKIALQTAHPAIHCIRSTMQVRASTRISIRWPPAPASEPTDTLVLSVGDYYVDLRVTKLDQKIDWALAGQRIVVSEDPRVYHSYLAFWDFFPTSFS